MEGAVEELKASTGSDVQAFAGDLSIAASAEELARLFPNVEILVNNLGIFEPKPFEAIPDADWLRFFDVSVLSGIRLARLVPASHETPQLGTNHFHLQRKCGADSGRNDPLRHDENCATRASLIASRIRAYVPQRQILPLIASSISDSFG